jgi:hypothetical protein
VGVPVTLTKRFINLFDIVVKVAVDVLTTLNVLTNTFIKDTTAVTTTLSSC